MGRIKKSTEDVARLKQIKQNIKQSRLEIKTLKETIKALKIERTTIKVKYYVEKPKEIIV